MKHYGKTEKINTDGVKGDILFGDILISAGLVIIGLVMAAANVFFNFIFSGSSGRVKTTLFVKLMNRFLNSCALSFHKLEKKLSFHIR